RARCAGDMARARQYLDAASQKSAPPSIANSSTGAWRSACGGAAAPPDWVGATPVPVVQGPYLFPFVPSPFAQIPRRDAFFRPVVYEPVMLSSALRRMASERAWSVTTRETVSAPIRVKAATIAPLLASSGVPSSNP